MIAEDLRRMADGEPPLHVVNPETLASFCWEGERPVVDPGTIAGLGFRPRPAVSDLQQEMPARAYSVPESATVVESKVAPGSLRERVGLILELFLSRIALDERLHEFAAGHTVSSHYFLNDLGLEFHIGFGQGNAYAALGPPPEPADIKLKAKVENLDAILTGRIGGNRAAMTGKLSFSGNIAVAMGLQKIQPDLIRLYSAAKEEAGGIDFSMVAAPPVVAVASHLAATPAPTGSASSPGAGTTETQGLREEMTRITGELLAADLITATGGNVSVRIPGTNQALITPSQLYKGELTSAMMVRVDMEGNGLDADALAPSSERQLHCEIYKARPDVEAVIHAHATYATIIALADIPFLPVSTEAAFLGDIPRVPFAMPGSAELADSVRQALGGGMAVLMQNHGLVVAAGSLRHAADTAEVIERASQMIWSCYALGKEPSVLPGDILGLLREIGHMIA
jgi:ribulose-5-phosphate 4-epimerase/fuculose-1-phosphate aldolase/putative sterol carrier protein